MIIFLIPLLLFSLIESSIIALPFSLCLLLVLLLIYKSEYIIVMGFIVGVLIDSLMGRILGSTGLFFTLFLSVILLYQRKFEIDSLYFVVVASFIGTILYELIFGYRDLVLQSILGVGLSALLFIILHKFNLHKIHR